MLRPRYAILAIALIASAAGAQRGGGGINPGRTNRGVKEADWDKLNRESSTAVKLSNGDVEDMNPVKLLVDKRKDLKLTDDQQKQLKGMVEQLKETNKPTFKTLDSLRNESRPKIDGDAAIEQVRTGIAREQMRGIVENIRGTYAAALNGALAVLDETQKPKANDLLTKQTADSEETLKEKLGGSRGGGGGGGRGRPPA